MDEKGCIGSLGVQTAIDKTFCYVEINADLTLRNGGGVWDEGKSDITKDLSGENYDTITFNCGEEFGGEKVIKTLSDLDLTLKEPSAEGYTFLGWWRSDESGEWEKVNSLSYSGGQEITLHALWVKAELDAECNVVSDGGWFKDSTYEAKGTVSIEFKGCDVYQDAEIAITSATLKMNKVFGSDSYSYREIIDDEVSFDFLKGKYYSWNMSVNVKITIGKEVFELNQVTDNGSF